MQENAQVIVDPAVSREKFAHEIDRYHAIADQHRSRGCWLVHAEFPVARVVFATDKPKPNAVVFGAQFDFTNYDFVPPSVRLANPFTWELLRTRDVPAPPAPFRRIALVQSSQELLAQGAPPMIQQEQHLLQSYGPDDLPFLCIQGVREYHDHPQHSDDPWLPRRKSGEGTLNFLIEQLWKYGVEPLSGMNMGMQLVFNGFAQGNVPQ